MQFNEREKNHVHSSKYISKNNTLEQMPNKDPNEATC